MSTPLDIEIALHYQTRPGDYRNGDFSALAVQEAINRFTAAGLLAEGPSFTDERKRRPTEGMRVYVESLCAVQLPEQIWRTPMPPAPKDW